MADLTKKKKAHQLTHNNKSELPEHIIIFDTETSPTFKEDIQYNSLRLGWGVYWRRSRNTEKWFEFTTIESFWWWVIRYAKPKTKLYLIAHNIGFDSIIVDTYYQLPEKGYKIKRFYDEATTSIIQWVIEKEYKDKKGETKTYVHSTIMMIDSMNYFKDSVANLGEAIGYEKLKVDFENVSDEELSIYCKRDVEIVKRTLENWFDFHQAEDLGNFAYTIAGQSLNTYRHKFMSQPIFIHENEKVYALERASYFGGRTECFYIGKLPEKLFVFDVNSMYPSTMINEEYPTHLVGYLEDIELEMLEEILLEYLVVAEVEVNTDIPIFPVKYNNKLIFPIGEFTCSLSTPELKEGLKRGLVKRVNKVSVYEKANIFKEYVSYFYEKRLEAKKQGDDIKTMFYKLFLNSLYGKFGQRSTGWEIIGYTKDLNPKRWTEYDIEENETYTYRQFGGCIQKKGKIEYEAFDSFPAIASHVTSYARLLLYNYMEIAGRENVFYCDTDSIFTNDEGRNKLEQAGVLDNNELGKLKLEYASQSSFINGLKDYELYEIENMKFTEKIKMKGVKKNAEFVGINAEGKKIFRQEQWSRLSGMVATGNIKDHKITKIEKTLQRNYNKGSLLSSGKVIPFNMKELLEDKIKEIEQHALLLEDKKLRKYFRQVVISLGGVNDKAFENIPRWSKRKKGKSLDLLVSEINEFGFPCEDSNELHNLLLVY